MRINHAVVHGIDLALNLYHRAPGNLQRREARVSSRCVLFAFGPVVGLAGLRIDNGSIL